ncbi:unnamed protein product [Arabis nemorensis]|uniref:DNA topoisomerase (ATP-hydrolyzing) n=1 Tax=Arabis nemorensis TaxID=586526 RepID=A0A565BMH8_9BRAS|nr:unnamed protein product [Arabis nemorensis]
MKKHAMPLMPYYKGFKGNISKDETKKQTYTTTGSYKVNPLFSDVVNCSDDTNAPLKLTLDETNMKWLMSLKRTEILKTLKLTSSISTRNVHLFDAKGDIQKYEMVEEIIESFCFEKLREHEDREFIDEIRNGSISLSSTTRIESQLIEEFTTGGYEVVRGVSDFRHLRSMELDSVLTSEYAMELSAKRKIVETKMQYLNDNPPRERFLKAVDAFVEKLEKLETAKNQKAKGEKRKTDKEPSKKNVKKQQT